MPCTVWQTLHHRSAQHFSVSLAKTLYTSAMSQQLIVLYTPSSCRALCWTLRSTQHNDVSRYLGRLSKNTLSSTLNPHVSPTPLPIVLYLINTRGFSLLANSGFLTVSHRRWVLNLAFFSNLVVQKWWQTLNHARTGASQKSCTHSCLWFVRDPKSDGARNDVCVTPVRTAHFGLVIFWCW